MSEYGYESSARRERALTEERDQLRAKVRELEEAQGELLESNARIVRENARLQKERQVDARRRTFS